MCWQQGRAEEAREYLRRTSAQLQALLTVRVAPRKIRAAMPRYLYHALPRSEVVGEGYAPSSLETEGFIHCSFAPQIHESVRLYLRDLEAVDVVQLDPLRLQSKVLVEETPRGPMPHVFGPLSADAVVARTPFLSLPERLPDETS